MTGRKPLPDILADLPRHRRAKRELEDTGYLIGWAAANSARCFGTDESRALASGFGLNLSPAGVADIGFVICSRVDLDHPIILPDNLFTDCADCDCNLQFRPNNPAAGDHLCICCSVRRLRKEATENDK